MGCRRHLRARSPVLKGRRVLRPFGVAWLTSLSLPGVLHPGAVGVQVSRALLNQPRVALEKGNAALDLPALRCPSQSLSLCTAAPVSSRAA